MQNSADILDTARDIAIRPSGGVDNPETSGNTAKMNCGGSSLSREFIMIAIFASPECLDRGVLQHVAQRC
jgi:hypothetical protein